MLEPVLQLCKAALDPKQEGDAEVQRYAMLMVANLAVSNKNNELIVKEALDIVSAYVHSLTRLLTHSH